MSSILSQLLVEATAIHEKPMLNVLESEEFSVVYNSLLKVWFDCIKVYTNKSLKDIGSIEMAGGTATYFSAANADVGIKMTRLLSSILTEL
ncbi:hypothetical protein G9A89_008850 [Geosiphon pyriformis]|nr:hypothetical protein G9A89_008850 [Geosiphon pyriformis]